MRGPRSAPRCQAELQDKGKQSKAKPSMQPGQLCLGLLPSSQQGNSGARNYLLNYPARQELCAAMAMGKHCQPAQSRAHNCSQPSAAHPELSHFKNQPSVPRCCWTLGTECLRVARILDL